MKDSIQTSGFNPSIVSKNRFKSLPTFDQLRLRILYAKRYYLWGYCKKKPSKWKSFVIAPLLFLPFQMEIVAFKKLHKDKKPSIKYLYKSWKDQRKVLFKIWRYALSSEIKESALLPD